MSSECKPPLKLEPELPAHRINPSELFHDHCFL
jgi:hypothetical protein